MAASTMVIGGRSAGTVGGVAARSGQTYFFFAPLFIPFFILGVPIVDMAFAFVRRTANRTGFSTPDKNHLHHRLLRLGHGHRRSVLILWAWTVLLSGFVLFPLYISSVNAFIPFGVAGPRRHPLHPLPPRRCGAAPSPTTRPRTGRRRSAGRRPPDRAPRAGGAARRHRRPPGGRRPARLTGAARRPRRRFPDREQHVSGVLPRYAGKVR